MTRYGLPLKEYVLSKKLDVGIQFTSELGLVPEIEEREAAVFCQVPYYVWTELPWQERSSCLAHYRLHLMIEAHIDDAQAQDAERRANMASRKK